MVRTVRKPLRPEVTPPNSFRPARPASIDEIEPLIGADVDAGRTHRRRTSRTTVAAMAQKNRLFIALGLLAGLETMTLTAVVLLRDSAPIYGGHRPACHEGRRSGRAAVPIKPDRFPSVREPYLETSAVIVYAAVRVLRAAVSILPEW